MVGDLKRLFDAGLGAGSECDLREFQPDELDPNAVASCFKNWLRSCKFSLILSLCTIKNEADESEK